MLRTLVETELAARDASNVANRLKAAAFPVAKTLDAFDVDRLLDPAEDLRLPVESGMGSRTTESGDDRPSRDRQESTP